METLKDLKNLKINLVFEITEMKAESYSSELNVFSNTHNKTLVCNNLSSKEDLLNEIKEHFQDVLKDAAIFIKQRNIAEAPQEKETELTL